MTQQASSPPPTSQAPPQPVSNLDTGTVQPSGSTGPTTTSTPPLGRTRAVTARDMVDALTTDKALLQKEVDSLRAQLNSSNAKLIELSSATSSQGKTIESLCKDRTEDKITGIITSVCVVLGGGFLSYSDQPSVKTVALILLLFGCFWILCHSLLGLMIKDKLSVSIVFTIVVIMLVIAGLVYFVSNAIWKTTETIPAVSTATAPKPGAQ